MGHRQLGRGEDVLKGLLRERLRVDLGAALRAHGFRGTVPTWRRSNDAGDWVVLNVQSSAWNSADSLSYVVNLAGAPEPWLDWNAHRYGRRPKQPSEADGLLHRRLLPTGADPEGSEVWWSAHTPAEVEDTVADLVARVEREGLPLLRSWLDREQVLGVVRRRSELFPSMGEQFAGRAEACLLVDVVSDAEMARLVERARWDDDSDAPFAAWVAQRRHR